MSTACIVFSYGVSDNWAFEEAVVELYRCQVHAFDPTVDRVFESFTLHRVGYGNVSGTYAPGTVPFLWPGIDFLRTTNGRSWVLWSVKDAMRTLWVRHIDLLKMDAEGAEWFLLSELTKSGGGERMPISQLCLELHFPPTRSHVLENTVVMPPEYAALLRDFERVYRPRLHRLTHNGDCCIEVCFRL
jgi:hypothetical protein